MRIFSCCFLLLYYPIITQAQWVQRGSDISGVVSFDYAGRSIGLSADGNIIAIGAPGNSQFASGAGTIRMYAFDGIGWNVQGAPIFGEAAGDNFGISVSISDDGLTVAAGATGNIGAGAHEGHVRVFVWNGSSWNLLGQEIYGEAPNDSVGLSVALNGDGTVLAAGSIYNDGTGSYAGHVRIYEYNGSSWVQKGSDIDGESAGDKSGMSVAITPDGNTVAIGASGNDGNGSNSGHLRVFYWSGSAWVQKGADIDGEHAGDICGISVDINDAGNRLIAGSPGNSDGGFAAGSGRVFQWTGNAWAQMGGDIDGAIVEEEAAWSVGMSALGDTIAVGSRFGGWYNGAARVFSWNGTAWNGIGNYIDSVYEAGYEVGLSQNGAIIALGADLANAPATASGNVSVYERVSTGIDGSHSADIRLWPNPSSGLVFQRGIHERYTATVKNLQGQILSSQKNLPNEPFILPETKGLYLVEIEHSGMKVISKILKSE
jgi:hypothetical protein